jgi:signal-transduction protein with cAMP-binding, CBS, and nucleotidyltransferase domain
MALISDSKGVLRSQEAKTFIDRFQNSINARITGMEGGEALTLLHDIRDRLAAEETAVNHSVCEIETLLLQLAAADSNDEVELIAASFHQLAAAQFKNRASVSTFHAHYSRFTELLITFALKSAESMLTSEGTNLQDKGSGWCLLVSGKLGRNEPDRKFPGRLILLTEDTTEFSRDAFNQFAYSFLAILEQLLPPGEKKAGAAGRSFWSGTTREWLELVDAGLKGGSNPFAYLETLPDEDFFADTFRMIADLRPICGAMALANEVLDNSRKRVAQELNGERFRQFARQTTAMPVAISFFGRFRIARTGKHRGKFCLEELAIDPFIASIRILAVASGITETATVSRVKGILATGNLGVALADHLLIAYHDFMKTFIELQISAKNAADNIFFNPDDLDEYSRERFRIGLEDITTLQRLVYQQLVEAD